MCLIKLTMKQVSDTTEEEDDEDDYDSERLGKLDEERKPLKSSLKVSLGNRVPMSDENENPHHQLVFTSSTLNFYLKIE